ncbi:MAG: small multi-drug export protein [Bacteroidia bacterium]|nr:small multi-drug export protein [Bacteroidia bacterium]MCF8427437.1 small multi-drug export protein [Bacteroidia bacterium]
MEYLLKVLSVVVWSAIKYIVGIGMAIGFGFNQIEILVYTVGGGMLGVVFYLYLWALILNIYYRYYPKKNKPIKFSKYKRKLVKFIRKYEVWGIALITPIILTPPVGTILAATIEHNKWRIKLIMLASFCFWTLIILGFKLLLKIDFEKLF